MSVVVQGTDFQLPGQKNVYHGKVRDVYDLGDRLVFITSDRYSAFDRHLAIVPHKGELLTATSKWWFEQTEHIVKNHIITYPDVNVAVGEKCRVIPIEMIVRGYITGVTNTSLWHTYSNGQRDYGTFSLPEGLYKNQKLPEPVLTPTTKFEAHDRNLTPEQAIEEGLVAKEVWEKLKVIALELFNFGQQAAEQKGLILVDTKYEFGLNGSGEIVLIDEIHTQDSSRYWRADSYEQSIKEKKEPDNYDKEFLRLWFKERFDPYSNASAPTPPREVIEELVKRYTYVYEHLTGDSFKPATDKDPIQRIEQNILKSLKKRQAS